MTKATSGSAAWMPCIMGPSIADMAAMYAEVASDMLGCIGMFSAVAPCAGICGMAPCIICIMPMQFRIVCIIDCIICGDIGCAWADACAG